MDRYEAIMRELNLLPRWKVRAKEIADTTQSGVVVEVDKSNMDLLENSPDHSSGIDQKKKQGGGEKVFIPRNKEEGLENSSDSLNDSPLRSIQELGWSELKKRVHDCTSCKLRSGCTQTVFGVGDENAEWLFIGEGPGAEEDLQGEPFVGQAGKLLDNMLASINIKRGENVYITNIVKCRPPGNRNPDHDEIYHCLPYIHRQIELIQPRIIVALGKVASNALLEVEATLASLRGKLHDFRGIPMVVTYHPAYLLRSPNEKAKAWQDLMLAVNTQCRD